MSFHENSHTLAAPEAAQRIKAQMVACRLRARPTLPRFLVFFLVFHRNYYELANQRP
jgi:hypothetical protein